MEATGSSITTRTEMELIYAVMRVVRKRTHPSRPHPCIWKCLQCYSALTKSEFSYWFDRNGFFPTNSVWYICLKWGIQIFISVYCQLMYHNACAVFPIEVWQLYMPAVLTYSGWLIRMQCLIYFLVVHCQLLSNAYASLGCTYCMQNKYHLCWFHARLQQGPICLKCAPEDAEDSLW